MSYMAEAIMKQNMSPEEYKRNVEGMPPPADQPAPAEQPAAPEPEKPTQLTPQALSPEGAANIAKERKRYEDAGFGGDASRLLGGPRERLGA